MLKSLVYLQQRCLKKLKILTKIVNVDEENLHIYQTTWGISMNILGKPCIIKVKKKKQDFTLSLENTVLEKP